MKNTIFLFMSLLLIGMAACKKTDTTSDKFPPIDIDGNVYDTVKIGTQVWMVQNLRTTRYNDGTPISTLLNDAAWKTTTSGAYAIYNNDNANNTTYGKLYNWYAVNTGKLSPKGWHIPSDAEWTTLATFLGGASVAGCALKATVFNSHLLWNSPNTCANNGTGFSGIPGGVRTSDGFYSDLGSDCFFWTTTDFDTNTAWLHFLDYFSESLDRSMFGKNQGFSIRCIRD